MAYKDLREFIKVLEEVGELARIEKEVDWNLEAGAIMRRAYERWAPAQLFQKIKDYPSGYRLMGGALANFKRLALAMEMDPNSNYTEILDKFDSRRKRSLKPIILSDGACKEEVRIGNEVDLLEFPVPIIHGGDGGRYIGTWNVGACKDPDSDWVNWGTYRLMVHDRNTTGIYINPAQHLGLIFYGKYEARNKPMEYAAFIGLDPIINLVGATGVPYGISEVDVVGGIRGEPVSLVKCETVDLYVPANAEIVIEGEVLPHERKDEGPFGEYAGYQVSGTVKRPVYRVKAITHRKNPILTASCIGVPPDDGSIAISISAASEFRTALIEAGIPVTGIYIPPQCAMHLAVVAAKTPYPYVATRIANCIWSQKGGRMVPRIIVVNDDVDPTNMDQVLHAFATKCHPVRGTTTIEHLLTTPITGFLAPHERKLGMGAGVVYDCTWPVDWAVEDIPPRSSFEDIYPQEIKELILKNWKDYGFTD